MRFLEKDLEQIIYDADVSDLLERGLHIHLGKTYRQLRIGNYGIADLVVIETERDFQPHSDNLTSQYQCINIGIHVYELKLEQIDYSALHQAIGYVTGIESYLQQRFDIAGIHTEIHNTITLIGRSLNTQSSIVYAPSVFGNINLYTYDYKIDGIRFYAQNNYSLRNEGFKFRQKRKTT